MSQKFYKSFITDWHMKSHMGREYAYCQANSKMKNQNLITQSWTPWLYKFSILFNSSRLMNFGLVQTALSPCWVRSFPQEPLLKKLARHRWMSCTSQETHSAKSVIHSYLTQYSSINSAYKIVQSKAQTKVPRLKWWQQVQKCFNSESHASNRVTAQTQHLWFMTQLCFMGYTAFLSARNRAFLARIHRAASWQSSLVEFKNSLGKLKVEQSLCSLFHYDVLQLLHMKTDSPCHWSVWCCKRCIAMPCEAHQRSSWRAASAWFISHQHVKSIQRQSSLWP